MQEPNKTRGVGSTGFLFLVVLLVVAAGCNGGGSAPMTPPPAATYPRTTEICGNFEKINYKTYIIENNQWGRDGAGNEPFMQCVFLTETANDVFEIGWTWQWPVGNGNVKAYPEIYFGTKFGQRSAGSDILPARADQLPEIVIDYEYAENDTAALGQRNIAFESWFHDSTAVGLDNRVFEMMVWVDRSANFYPPGYIEDVPVDGALYELYSVPSGIHSEADWGYIAFVSKAAQTQGKLRWNSFVEASIQRGLIDATSYLADVEFGSEIISGEGTLTVTEFNITVE